MESDGGRTGGKAVASFAASVLHEDRERGAATTLRSMLGIWGKDVPASEASAAAAAAAMAGGVLVDRPRDAAAAPPAAVGVVAAEDTTEDTGVTDAELLQL